MPLGESEIILNRRTYLLALPVLACLDGAGSGSLAQEGSPPDAPQASPSLHYVLSVYPLPLRSLALKGCKTGRY